MTQLKPKVIQIIKFKKITAKNAIKMENGIIIDGETYEYVDGVEDKRDQDQLHNVCGSCALYEKCDKIYGDHARHYPCDIFEKGWMWHFKKKEEK